MLGIRIPSLSPYWFALAAILLLPARAQQQNQPSQSDSGTLLFKRTVNRVIVDVVVTDSTGKPVPGLTRQDFSVSEDNKPQQILSFDVHSLETKSDFVKLPPLPPNTFINAPTAPERGPLYVLLLDLDNTEMTDQMVARQQLVKFVQNKPAGTRFAVFVLSDGLHLIQGFTDDQQTLLAAVDPSKPRRHLPKVFLMGKNFWGEGDKGLMMVSIFEFIGRFLDGLPGRKNLIWFSGEFPLALYPTDSYVESSREQIRDELDTLAKSQIAIYPVDVRGVAVEDPHAPGGSTGGGGLTSDSRDAGVVPAGTTAANSSAPLGGVSNAGNFGYSLLMASYSVQDDIAKTTGGLAFHSNNDLAGGLEEATENGANYYALSYSPSNQNYDGGLRRIHVSLAKSGYHLAYRSSYYAINPDIPAPGAKRVSVEPATTAPVRKVGDSLFANMQHGAPLAHELYFRAHIHAVGEPRLGTPEQMANLADQPAYFRVRKKNRPVKPITPIQLQTYAVDYTLTVQVKPGQTVRPPNLEIAVAAFDSDGNMLNGMVENTVSNAAQNAPANTTGVFRAQEQIDVPLAAASMRIAVRDIPTDHIGAMEISLPLAPEPQTQADSRPLPSGEIR